MSYQYELLKKITFNRYGGTEDELRCANILADEIRSFGGEPTIECFEVEAYIPKKASFTITKPFRREIEVNLVGRSGSTPEGGITAPFVYVENADEVALRDVAGKIIMVNNTGYETYKRMVKSGAAAFVVFSGTFHDIEGDTDIDKRLLRPNITENGTIPGVCMRTAEAIKLVQDGACEAHIEVLQENCQNTSRNVTAFIEGSDFPDEEILLTAHYDSTIYGCGAWDNGSGAVNIMEMFKYYMADKPRRSLRFIWCGSEEQGLLGSKAYAAAHKDEVEKIRLTVNFDMTGTTLGYGLTMITGSEKLRTYAESIANEMGYTSRYVMDVHSSDSAPFAKLGVPAIGIARDGQAGGHSRFDLLWPLSADTLERATDYAKRIIDRSANAEVFPIEREMPDNMKEKLEKYFLYGKKAEKK